MGPQGSRRARMPGDREHLSLDRAEARGGYIYPSNQPKPAYLTRYLVGTYLGEGKVPKNTQVPYQVGIRPKVEGDRRDPSPLANRSQEPRNFPVRGRRAVSRRAGATR